VGVPRSYFAGFAHRGTRLIDDLTRLGTESLQTPRWRGLDSNFQYAGAVNLVVAPFVRRVRIVLVIVFSLAMA